jgi:tRNA A37 methylthiotransferase MiaB
MAMRADLEAAGMKAVSPGSGADVIVVNTCTVTRRSSSKESARGAASWRPRS